MCGVKRMRGTDVQQGGLFSYVSLEDRIPTEHPLRGVRALLEEALASMSRDFDRVYSQGGRASIPPERLVRALTLQILYSIRSERLLCEQLEYNLLFRWFVGLTIDEAVWDHSTFTKNRERLLEHKVLPALFSAVLRQARKRHLLSDEHFSVDGTLIDAWASHKSFRPRDEDDDGGPQSREVDFHGERRTNETHVSKTDPDAELMRKSKGKESRLRYGVHHLMENRNCLVVGVKTTKAASVTERVAAQELLIDQPGEHRKTVGGDKGFDTCDFVEDCRILNVTPHVAQNIERKGGSAIDRRTTRHSGYTISQRKRKMIETTFGWAKQYGGLRRMMYRSLDRVEGVVIFTMTVFNLLRICNLQPKWQE